MTDLDRSIERNAQSAKRAFWIALALFGLYFVYQASRLL